MPVVEPVAVHMATSRRGSSSASYTGRRSHRGSVPSTSSGRYYDVGLDDNSARRELKGRRQEVAMFLRRELVMILIRGGAMRGHVQARGFGGPPVAAAVLVEDSEEDPEEDSLGIDEYVPRSYTPNPVDPEDFDPWDELMPCFPRNVHPKPESSLGDATSRLVEAIERLNPLVAENWIRELEKIFLLTDVSETQKVVWASFMLKEGASHWWDMIKRAYRTDEHPMIWALFKTLFLEKYFPRVKREENEAEFISLK
ncbi:hypothetical protein FNV43_RR09907 [Rhamnella rubrinervis]|uniref:Retrotransposon gag domain-containing protein n=1 Tax=Rhamnella rubrinervis TaxID=2594499 RepID=A0A8K0MK81_9ROSA|nr:hypothetical protein FNV43_RR09907 [Rhamnella rubrinervis]